MRGRGKGRDRGIERKKKNSHKRTMHQDGPQIPLPTGTERQKCLLILGARPCLLRNDMKGLTRWTRPGTAFQAHRIAHADTEGEKP